MKKILLAMVALALAGCTTHGQFKAAYLEKYAGYDCQTLKAERSSSEAQLLRLRGKRSSITGAERRGIRVIYIDHALPPGNISFQERRMRQHARKEAVLQLQLAQGCQNENPNPMVNNRNKQT